MDEHTVFENCAEEDISTCVGGGSGRLEKTAQ
jgi:hypothetical protein